MENKAHAMAAGIFVALLTALVLGLAAWLTRETGVRDPYEISTKETVTGLQEQAPVRYRGVDVGKVKRIGFDPKQTGNVLLRLEIDRDAPLTRSTYATLSYQGVTGLAFIQLQDEGPAPRLIPNDQVPPRLPLRPGLLQKLEEHGDLILDRVEEATKRLNSLLSDENQKRVGSALESIDRAAASASELTASLNTTVKQKLGPALDQATVTMKRAQGAIDQVGSAATQFGQTAQRINAPGGPLDRVGQGTDALVQAADTLGSTTLPRINRTAEEATRTLHTLNRAVNELTENPQMLIYGEGQARPGPGEPGFQVPGARR